MYDDFYEPSGSNEVMNVSDDLLDALCRDSFVEQDNLWLTGYALAAICLIGSIANAWAIQIFTNIKVHKVGFRTWNC